MKPHKWAKEIKAWADGAEIEYKKHDEDEWMSAGIFPAWYHDLFQYRIKPQPKEPQYLYVYGNKAVTLVSIEKAEHHSGVPIIGKIKLEQDE